MDDPDDDEVAGDLLTGLSAHLQQLGVNQLLEAQNLGKKSALLETQLDSHPDPNLPDLERELTGSVFPKKLLVAGILAEDTAYEDLRPAMAECAAEQGFLTILLGRFGFWENPPIEGTYEIKYSLPNKNRIHRARNSDAAYRRIRWFFDQGSIQVDW